MNAFDPQNFYYATTPPPPRPMRGAGMSGVNSVNLTAAATAFDKVARSYDDVFTRSVIGRAQRSLERDVQRLLVRGRLAEFAL